MTAKSILIPVSTCKKCGESNFREDGRCRTCQRISHQAWVQNNAEKMRAYRNKYAATNTDDNIQLLRKLCNHKKGTKHPVDFMQERGFLL